MKVLLINPAWKVINDRNMWRKVISCCPSLGLAYIAAALEQKKHEVLFLDMQAENYSPDDVLALLQGDKYTGLDYVGITATSPLINCAFKLAEVIKLKFPDVKVVFGGVHSTILFEEVFKDKHVDIVVRGEGELTMCDIVGGVELSKILGISYRVGDKVVSNPDRPNIEDLDDLPIPAYHLMPINKYGPSLGSYKRLPAMPILATRGCPGACTFCYRSFKGKVRSRSAKKIIEEIKVLQRDYGIKEINFYDDTFTALRSNVEEFCILIIEEKIDVTWSCLTRVNYVDKDLFRLMKSAGCHQVMFGVESGVQEILDKMNKRVTLDQVRKAVAICKEVGIETRAAYMIGNIGETKEMMERTFDFAVQLDTDYAQFNILTPYPGTRVWDLAVKNGWLRVKNYEYSDMGDTPTMALPTVSWEEITGFFKQLHFKYYLRPKVFWRRLIKLRSWTHIKQEAYGLWVIVSSS